MGNASGRSEGESTSGAKYEEGYEGQEEGGVEYLAPHPHPSYLSQVSYVEADPMIHLPTNSPRRFLQPPLVFSPQVPVVPFLRPGEAMLPQNYALHQSMDVGDVFREKLTAVIITWSYGGKQVAVTGSWDNWENREPLQRSGEDFILMKMLPSGVYHYRFIVDECLRYAPDLPWERDDSGTAYNILDVQEYAPEVTESLSEFELPPSPESSYNNEPLNDFGKHPPDLPPQIHQTLLNERSSAIDSHESLPRPQNAVLNHLYIQNNHGQPVALGSTHRFRQKYVTVVLYKPSRS